MKHAQLKAFHAVAQHRGFTAAARSLGLTQPAVTLQVQALEKRYNTPLFVRRGRTVDLTQSGILLHSLSKRYFSLEEEAHTLMTSITQLTAGKIRIASDRAPRVFPLTTEFRTQYPGIELSVSICHQLQIEENLLDHLVDVAFTGLKPTDPLLESLEIGQEDMTIALPIQFPVEENTAITFDKIADQKIILYTDSDGIDPIEEQLVELSGFPTENIVRYQNREMAIEAVAHSQGISFLSEKEVSHDRRLKSAPLAHSTLKRVDYLAYHKEKRDTPLIAAFRKLHKPNCEEIN